MSGDNNGAVSRLLWWVVGLIGSSLVLGGGFLVSTLVARVDTLYVRVGASEVVIATMKETLRALDDLAKAIRTEQVDRTFRFGELGNKISSIDMRMQLLDDRYKTISERILAINNRLDQGKGKEIYEYPR